MTTGLELGSEFAGHRLEAIAGRGGMSTVYRAARVEDGGLVALKVVGREFAGSRELRDRFARECDVAASLDHPNVMPLYDWGERDGLLWVTMRYVGGQDLRALSAGSPVEPRRAAAIVASVAGALDAAHARGLVHRDVKPGNVLVESRAGADGVWLADFGLAKRVSADPDLTPDGNWLGTAAYAAPEQIRGRAVDARADVYALGGTLHHALTGEVPYPRGDDDATMRAHLHEPPPRPAGELGDVVARAMAKHPAERFPSAGELGRAAVAAAETAAD
ncbi:MAG TPA: serine/threonine-protein kinase [Thermoleophilaceae bacterium]